MYDYENFASGGSKTVRKNARREIRNVLGTSSEDAPTLYEAVQAARYLDQLLDYASGGNMRLEVALPSGSSAVNRTVTPTEALSYIRDLRASREAQRGQ